MYELEQVWAAEGDGEGFYALRGGSNWATVEGHAAEWLALAAAIRGRRYEGFRRCAVSAPKDVFVSFWSPRNAVGPNDHVEMDLADADALAAQIVAVLREAGEACVRDESPAAHPCA